MDKTTALRAYVEAAIDFPDEDVDFLADGEVARRLVLLAEELGQVRRYAGASLPEGLSVVLAGAPNAGKSSLLNQLARQDAAIVTDIPGTTRDVLRERIDLEGLPVQITDTAGLRETDDVIEAEGVRRALQAVGDSDVLVYLVDALAVPEGIGSRAELESALGRSLPPHVIVVRNKIDLLGEAPSMRRVDDIDVVSLCALDGSGLDGLAKVLRRIAGLDAGDRSTIRRAASSGALDVADEAFADALRVLDHTGSGGRRRGSSTRACA